MKKILLSLVFLSTIVVVRSQTCGTGNIRRWTGTGQAGDMPGTVAPITINGSSADWEQWISGPFNYAGTPKGGLETDPYLAPVAAANVQKDGLKDVANGVNYDRDAVGQDHRDLRYFAFTYDVQNIYFFFRRPKNNTAQVSLYYFIDINVDGWMKNGEPVIKITFNNSGSTIEMGYYQTALPNGIPASALDPVQGNIMTAPSARAKTNNTSEWEQGAADGWSMPGNFVSFGNGVSLPALVAGEVFAANTLTDTHPDGTVAGYGVEFAVPWKYLRMYNAQGSAGSPLTYQNVFTWHVSLASGNSGVSGAEDNAGGCCSGLAVSGAPDVSGAPTFSTSSPFDFRYVISYTENRALNTAVTTNQIKIKTPLDANAADIPADAIKLWTMTGYADADCNGVADAAGVSFTYSDALSNTTTKEYIFTPSDPIATKIFINASASDCYFLDINTSSSWPPLKYGLVSFSSTTEFNLNTLVCNPVEIGGATNEIAVLPVKFTYFNAARSGSNVNLTWQTSSEENNRGFDIQRFTGAGGWQTVGFVSTQAVNGSSSSPLNYQFSDINTIKGITQYRLKQVDIDNRAAYSIIRSVRGDGQKGKTIVYPNPSSDGKINIVFEDINGTRDVQVLDMSGRTIKQWKALTNNNITIDNLNAGFYTVRIVNNETGDQSVEKFVVNKR